MVRAYKTCLLYTSLYAFVGTDSVYQFFIQFFHKDHDDRKKRFLLCTDLYRHWDVVGQDKANSMPCGTVGICDQLCVVGDRSDPLYLDRYDA